MSWTAHLHPEMIGEAAGLPPPLRIKFLIGIMRQESAGPFTAELDFLFPVHPHIPHIFSRRFHQIDDHAFAFETKLADKALTYLLSSENFADDRHLTELAKKRSEELAKGEYEPVPFLDYLHHLPEEEKMAALDVIAAESMRKMHIAIFGEAHEKSKKEMAALFNFSGPHMAAFEQRLDYYLGVINHHLHNHDGELVLQLRFNDRNIVNAPSLAALTKLR